jgi:hypothetical protein
MSRRYLPRTIEQSKFDDWTKDGASAPGTEVKWLAHAIEGNLAKTREGRFSGDGAEAGFDREGLEKIGSSHGFSEAKDAVWVILGKEKIEPLMDIVTFEKAVGGELAAAGAVSAGVGEKNGESVGEEKLSVSGHAYAVVAEAMEENYGVAVAEVGMNGPGAEGDSVRRGDGNLLEIRVESTGNFRHGRLRLWSERTAGGMQSFVGYEHSG